MNNDDAGGIFKPVCFAMLLVFILSCAVWNEVRIKLNRESAAAGETVTEKLDASKGWFPSYLPQFGSSIWLEKVASKDGVNIYNIIIGATCEKAYLVPVNYEIVLFTDKAIVVKRANVDDAIEERIDMEQVAEVIVLNGDCLRPRNTFNAGEPDEDTLYQAPVLKGEKPQPEAE